MIEPVAYMWKTASGNVLFQEYKENTPYPGYATPLYTAEQLHPRVKMTKEQYEILVISRNNAVNRVDKVGLLEFMSAYSLLNQEIDHLSLMQAWLHPENIKVVDE